IHLDGSKQEFRVDCEARGAGSLHVGADDISFAVAERVRIEGEKQLWGSIKLHCQKDDDGSLTVVILFHDPKLEEPLQIACVRSRPDATDHDSQSLQYDLNPQKID
ncbi:MAG TPA: hypothetical protein VEW05_28360, partial [Candidatus Polarisedimenticolia bacterium]|nr:hypothetical protein [Candidatus Polarisedimenticolia bacterium]